MDLHTKATKHRRRSVSSAVGLLHLRKLRRREEGPLFGDEMDSSPEPHVTPPDEERHKEQRTFFVTQSPLRGSTEGVPTLRRSNSSVVGNRIVSSTSATDFRSSITGRRYEMFGRPLPFVVHVVDGALREESSTVHFSPQEDDLQVDNELLVPMIVQHAVSLLRAKPGKILSPASLHGDLP